ncbi:TPA: hypothetical protein DCX15_05740, partial [bacterium]|nr:hypothetical protein [bacterium]
MAQIGSAVVKREDDGQMRTLASKQRIILLLPKQNQGISDTLWGQIRRIDKPDYFEIVDFTLPDKLADAKKDPRDKAGAKARSEMHKLEIELIKSTDLFRNENAWLILDGAVKFVEEDIWNSWQSTPYLIGVAKSLDRYLKKNGRLGFLITQSVFKTGGGGKGFRKFMLPDGIPIQVLHVDDMVELNPFEGASNRTSVVILQ